MFRWPLRDSYELCQDLMKSKPEPAVVMSAEINIFKGPFTTILLKQGQLSLKFSIL